MAIGIPLTKEGFDAVADTLGVKAPTLWALLTVETVGCGFLADKRPAILFERHHFHRLTKGFYLLNAPDISSPQPGGYEGGATEHMRYRRAKLLDPLAAMLATSWGIGQVMGFNYLAAGYLAVENMVKAMSWGEDEQLSAVGNFIQSEKLNRFLRARDWTQFARSYNGANYAINAYDTRLAAAYAKHSAMLPNMDLRTAQVCLMYLGYSVGIIDGIPGRKTWSALAAWQQAEGRPVKAAIDAETVKLLLEKAVG